MKTAKKHVEHRNWGHMRSNGRMCEALVWKEGDTAPVLHDREEPRGVKGLPGARMCLIPRGCCT